MLRSLLLLLLVWLLGGWAPAQAAGACSNRYFLPIVDGASWTFAGEPRARTIENVEPDSFEVHSAYNSQYNDQPDIYDVVDTYHCGPDGFSLVQHSEIGEVSHGSQFGGLYQGVALPSRIGPGSEWEYTYTVAGGDPSAPPVADEVRDRVTDHFQVIGPGSFTLGNGKQVAGLQVQHTTKAVQVIASGGESDDYSSDRTEFLAEGIGWVTRDLMDYSAGSQSFDQCPNQASTDAALHAAEDNLANQPVDAAGAAELSIAQASLSTADLVGAFGSVGVSGNQVSVEATTGLQRFIVRLDANGQPLPSLAAIDQLTSSACVQPGTLQGAKTLLVGALQQAGDQIRVTARLVDVATGQIQATNLADGTADSLPQTLQSALSALPLTLPTS